MGWLLKGHWQRIRNKIRTPVSWLFVVQQVWNVRAHAQKPDLVFQRNGRVHLNRRGSQFSRLLAVEKWASAGRLWIDHVPRHSARVVDTLSNRLFPLHFPSHASPCAITIRTASTTLHFKGKLHRRDAFWQPIWIAERTRQIGGLKVSVRYWRCSFNTSINLDWFGITNGKLWCGYWC